MEGLDGFPHMRSSTLIVSDVGAENCTKEEAFHCLRKKLMDKSIEAEYKPPK
jgi:hypothetical protein